MKINSKRMVKMVRMLTGCGGGCFGGATPEFVRWAAERRLSRAVVRFFERYMPQGKVWAGIGNLFEEADVIGYNDLYGGALQSGLLLIGACCDGDFIAMDCRVKKGVIGYIPHDRVGVGFDWRGHFEVVAESIGDFLYLSNLVEEAVADDYYDAVERREQGAGIVHQEFLTADDADY